MDNLCAALGIVSIHASVGEATRGLRRGQHGRQGFDPRLRGGGDVSIMFWLERSSRFRSTPPWGRRLALEAGHPALVVVSIHASVGEATAGSCSGLAYGHVSLHASVGEATRSGRGQ